jgi:uncharacterized coiled-coil DUF342 family protein
MTALLRKDLEEIKNKMTTAFTALGALHKKINELPNTKDYVSLKILTCDSYKLEMRNYMRELEQEINKTTLEVITHGE